jgi:hypothetical protein
MTNGGPDPFEDAPVIFSYSRRQAIEDGVLVDLTQWARESGFVIPVACTAAVWHQWIVPPEGTRELGQDERGRAHDLLWMLYCAIQRGGKGDQILFEVIFLQSDGKPHTVQLKSICGPGDQGDEGARGGPVLTILMPTED